jgi:hypothetical protein
VKYILIPSIVLSEVATLLDSPAHGAMFAPLARKFV